MSARANAPSYHVPHHIVDHEEVRAACIRDGGGAWGGWVLKKGAAFERKEKKHLPNFGTCLHKHATTSCFVS